MDMNNLFNNLPADNSQEIIESLLEAKNFLLERIVSYGQATPPDQWLDQDQDEWVILLKGNAGRLLKRLFMDMNKLFNNLPADNSQEIIESLLEAKNFLLERIVSYGQATPPDQWLDQDQDEWVILLKGNAGIQFQDESKSRELRPGDYFLISAHRRHRVEWTAPGESTVWLSIHH